jgi:hypothetical protein
MRKTNILRREARVAFSRRAQPAWFRILKWTIVIALGVMFWRAPLFWVCLVAAFVLSLALHLFWRWKTKGWTKPWGGWNDLETANKDRS